VIACGPSSNDVDWTSRFFQKLYRDYRPFRNIQGYAAHYYCGTAGTATEYTVDQWYELLARARRVEQLVVQQRAAMDVYDPERRIGLIVDEWGTWHRVIEGTNPRFLHQQSTIRDALVAAASLDIFNRHADKVVMANIAQTVNVLQAMVLTQEERMLVTPTGHVYEMYAPHQGGTSVRMLVDTDTVDLGAGGPIESLPVVAGSASLKGKTLYLTLTNSHAQSEMEVSVELLAGASVADCTARVLGGEIHAHNTFDRPHTVEPRPLDVRASGAVFGVVLPPASIVAAQIILS
jgi:alpha-N-arabinofuranosidase